MILGASALQTPAILQAKKLGLHVVAVDMNPDAVGFKFADEKLIISTIDADAVAEAAKKNPVDGVITLATDMPVRTLAAVAATLGLPGISIENAKKATDKVLMREALAAANVPIPYFFKATNEEEFLSAVKTVVDMGYRCIVKPADNSGSRGVNLLDQYDEESLHKAFCYSKENSRSGAVIVEEYMEGPELCVETLSVNGTCYPIQITDKLTTGAPYFVEMGHSQPSQLSEETQNKIRAVAVAANMAIGNYNGSSCTEIIVTKDGPKVVELGARLAGDYMTTDLVPLSTGVNMVDSIIKISMGETPDYKAKFEKASAIRFFDAPHGKIQSITGIDEACAIPGVQRVAFDRGVGEQSVEIKNSGDRIGYVIAQADTPMDAIRICEEAMKKVIIQVVKE